jgi:hypothetical protein
MEGDDMTTEERREMLRGAIESRQTLISLGLAMTVAGLAHLEIGQRIGNPRLAYRAGRLLIKAVDFYRRAELGRKAEAIGRLIERCRRAWIRWEESQGFK